MAASTCGCTTTWSCSARQRLRPRQRFGIQRQKITTQARGAFKEEEFIMGVAFTCGLEKVVLPSFKLGMPVEYELVRSIATVAGDQRKKLGVVKTDAEMMGGFSFAGDAAAADSQATHPRRARAAIQSRRSRSVEPDRSGRYDVLLIVQPSSLGPPQLINVVDAVRKGQPSVIFEDPYPLGDAAGRGHERREAATGRHVRHGRSAAAERRHWGTVECPGDSSHRRQSGPPQDAGRADHGKRSRLAELQPLSDDFRVGASGRSWFSFATTCRTTKSRSIPKCRSLRISRKSCFPYPDGHIAANWAKTKMTELVRTAEGRSGHDRRRTSSRRRNLDPYMLEIERGKPSKQSYILAAWIRGEADKASQGGEGEGEGEDGGGKADGQLVARWRQAERRQRDLRHRHRRAQQPVRADAERAEHDGGQVPLRQCAVRLQPDRRRRRRKSLPRNPQAKAEAQHAANGRNSSAAKARDKQKEANDKKQAEYDKAVKEADAEKDKAVADFKKIVDDLQGKQSRAKRSIRPSFRPLTVQLAMRQRIAERTAEVTKAATRAASATRNWPKSSGSATKTCSRFRTTTRCRPRSFRRSCRCWSASSSGPAAAFANAKVCRERE